MKQVVRHALLGLVAATLTVGSGAWAAEPVDSLRIMAPASPGGGWDGTSRAMQSVLQETGVVPQVEVFNVPGAGGTVGLSQLATTEKGNANLLMMMGLVMTGSILTNDAPVTLEQTTPIARLTGAYEVIVVPDESEFKTLDDLLAAFKADPGSISWAGGSAGGVDHILVGLIANEVGVDPKKMNYIPYSGGGAALAAILGGQVSAGVSSYSEWAGQIESGDLRALAISSAEPQAGLDIPTLMEQGIDLEVVNWRGVVAPPGISDEERAALVATMDEMVTTDAWKETLERYNWNGVYLSGDAFEEFLASEDQRVKQVLQDIGLVSR